MCGVLFGWIMTQTFIKELTNSDIRKRLVEERQKYLDEEITPFGIIYDGQAAEEQAVITVDDFTKFMTT